jgi:energy-coupling factor transporter ATP-binding protein EcfA2
MIKNIDIENFRCFHSLSASGCGHINVIVGDNGVGKTAFLEAIFAALSGGTELALRYRQQRGLDGNLTGSPRAIETAIFGDLFYQRDMTREIAISLSGDGPEARSLYISRGSGAFIPLPGMDALNMQPLTTGTLTFQWRDASGNVRPVSFQLNPSGQVIFSSTGEDLPDFFFFSSQQAVNGTETAARFSELSRSRRSRAFVEAFTREYPWIEDLSIEVVGGAPVLHAEVVGLEDKIPVSNVSGAISRIIAILLAVIAHPGGVVLVDEMENGVYHKHYQSMWRSILNFCRVNNTQLFTTTHSHEWISALLSASDGRLDDVVLWRVERNESGPVVRRFSGEQAQAATEVGGELR